MDTLIAHPDAIQTQMWDIYATSPQNVYVVGHTDWTGVNGNGIMWRYDGSKWSIINQGFRDISLESITGFGPTNIYAAGNKGPDALILHFDGVGWTQQILPGQPLYAVRGSSPSNIWTVGWMGTVFLFDGAQWTKIDVGQRFNFKDCAVFDRKTYAIAYHLDEQPRDTTWFYSLSWNGQRWDTVDVWLNLSLYTDTVTFGAQSLSVIDGELYSAGGGVFKFRSSRWEKIFNGPNVWKVVGPSQNNIFAAGFQGAVYHYNGSDWFQFTQFISSEFRYSGIWFDGKEVFVVGNNSSKTLVLHGK